MSAHRLTISPWNYLVGIFTHLKLCLADAIHNFKCVKIIEIWQNGNDILLIYFTFYLQDVQKLLFNVLINMIWNEYNRDRWLKCLASVETALGQCLVSAVCPPITIL